MVERRILSSRSGHGDHTGSQERSAKTPKPSISLSEDAWLSAGSPGERALEWMGKYQEPMESRNRGKGWRETHGASDRIS